MTESVVESKSGGDEDVVWVKMGEGRWSMRDESQMYRVRVEEGWQREQVRLSNSVGRTRRRRHWKYVCPGRIFGCAVGPGQPAGECCGSSSLEIEGLGHSTWLPGGGILNLLDQRNLGGHEEGGLSSGFSSRMNRKWEEREKEWTWIRKGGKIFILWIPIPWSLRTCLRCCIYSYTTVVSVDVTHNRLIDMEMMWWAVSTTSVKPGRCNERWKSRWANARQPLQRTVEVPRTSHSAVHHHNRWSCQIGVIVCDWIDGDELYRTNLSSKYWGHWGILYLLSLLVN